MKLNTEIRIEDNSLLGRYFDLSNYEVGEKIEEYRKEWIKREPFVMQKIEDVTGLVCKKNLIDVYILDKKRTDAISSPIIIGAGTLVEDFARVLAHEFIHNLAVDNKQGEDWSSKIRHLYPGEPTLVADHIMIHAILEAVFSKEEIDRDIEYCQKWTEYKKAWEIVKEEGHRGILKKLRNT